MISKLVKFSLMAGMLGSLVYAATVTPATDWYGCKTDPVLGCKDNGCNKLYGGQKSCNVSNGSCICSATF